MKRSILITSFCLLLTQCTAQNSSNSSYLEPMPYDIERASMNADLPDSLRGEGLIGFSILYIQINDKGEIVGFNIRKLTLNDGNKQKVINYLDASLEIKIKDNYPEDVKRYYDFLENYISEIRLKRIEGINPKPLNELTFMVRLQ